MGRRASYLSVKNEAFLANTTSNSLTEKVAVFTLSEEPSPSNFWIVQVGMVSL